ncbi:MAG: hypothetical protein IK099_14605 [Clostridia bacterium]|nr:hypothetical protein [Clostridia bacterium]
MRCGCPKCAADSYMVHSERDNCCVCPECLYRCYACQGDGQALSREAVLALKRETPGEQVFFLRNCAAEDASGQVAAPGLQSIRRQDGEEGPPSGKPFHTSLYREGGEEC